MTCRLAMRVVVLALTILLRFTSTELQAQSCSGERVANFVAVQQGSTVLLVATGQHPTGGYSRSWTKLTSKRYEFTIKAPAPDALVTQGIVPYRSRVRFTVQTKLTSVTIVETGGGSYTIPVTQL